MMDNRYGGFMVWSLDLDDFNGQFCGQGRYPLLKHMNDILRNGQLPSPR